MVKPVALVFVLLFCACPCPAMSVLHPTCANLCRGYTRDDVNYRYCVLACKEASTNKAPVDNVGYSYPSQLPNYFQNGEDDSMENGSESKIIGYYNPVDESHRVGEDYENWPPTGYAPKRSSPVLWRKATEDDPTDQGMSFVGTGRSNILLREGKSPMSEVEKRASSFVRIGRAPYLIHRGQDGPFIQLGKPIEEDETSGDPTLELENKRPRFVFESGVPPTEEQDQKRASSFVRIGRSYADSLQSNRAPGSFYSRHSDTGDKRASSFVRIGRSHLDNGETRARSFLEIGKSQAEVENMPSSVNRVRKSLTENEKKRASSFVRIGKSSLGEDEKRASSFVRIGKSLRDEEDKRASSFVRIGKSPLGLDEEEKRASSFVRVGKSLRDEDEKRASSFVRIGKSPLDVEEKRASSFVRIGKSPLNVEEKRASSFVRVGKSPFDEEEKRASSFVRIGKSILENEGKRASSFVRIGKSHPENEEKRASSFVRIGKSHPENEEKRASSFVRIGKSILENEGKRASSFVRIGKSHLENEEKRASSFVRIGKSPIDEHNKRASSFVRIGKSRLDNEDKRASSFVRIGKSRLDNEDKRASSFVRIGKSPLDEENGSTPFADFGKPSPSAHRRGAGSLLRRKKGSTGDESEKQAGSSTARTGGPSHTDSVEFQMNKHNQGKQYSASWRLRKPFPGESNDRNLLRISRPVVESLLNQNAGATPLLSSRKANQVLWIPVNDNEQRYLGVDGSVQDS